MNKKYLSLVLIVFFAIALSTASFALGFVLNRSKKSYDFNNIVYIQKTEIPKYDFLDADLSDYICEMCENLGLDPDLSVARLMVENPEFNNDAMHLNENGTVDCGLWQLNDKYLWTTFKTRYWFDNVELNPFNWKHNTYIALHHMKYLQDKFKVQDDAIMAYNCGEGAVMNGSVPAPTYVYLAKVKNNLWLLKNREE
jgi:hypothetical protein